MAFSIACFFPCCAPGGCAQCTDTPDGNLPATLHVAISGWTACAGCVTFQGSDASGIGFLQNITGTINGTWDLTPTGAPGSCDYYTEFACPIDADGYSTGGSPCGTFISLLSAQTLVFYFQYSFSTKTLIVQIKVNGDNIQPIDVLLTDTTAPNHILSDPASSGPCLTDWSANVISTSCTLAGQNVIGTGATVTITGSP